MLQVNSQKSRILGLDIMRATAIMLVFYAHSKPYLADELYSNRIASIDGVDIFFVLSGFLIGSILIKTIESTDFNKKDLLNFWVRRWFRTLPNYFFILTVLLILQLIIFKNLGNFSLTYLLFSQNLFRSQPWFFPESWSLSVEEWFYLLVPIVCWGLFKLLKNKQKAFFFSSLIFLVLPMLLRIIKYHTNAETGNFDLDFRKIVLLRLDNLMYGVFGAYIAFNFPLFWQRKKYFFLTFGIVLLLLLYYNPFNYLNNYPPISFTIEAITFFCFLPFLSQLKVTKKAWINSMFEFVSVISYSLYLIHYSLTFITIHFTIALLTNLTGLNMEHLSALPGILYVIYAFTGAYFLYRYYEMPMTNLREKYTPLSKR